MQVIWSFRWIEQVMRNCCSSFTSEAADRLQIMLSKKTFLCLYLFLACYGIGQIVAWTVVPCSSIPNVKFIQTVHSFGFTFHFSLHHWSATFGKATVDYQYIYWSKFWIAFIVDARKTLVMSIMYVYVSFAKIVERFTYKAFYISWIRGRKDSWNICELSLA